MTPPPAPERAAAPQTVLAIDPGSVKCGVAVVQQGNAGTARVLHREIADRDRLVARVLSLASAHAVEAVLLGDATGSAPLSRALKNSLPPAVPVLLVNEAFTSQRARRRFWEENPPRGVARLVPPGFRTPPHPYDDIVAVLLAEDFFAAGGMI